jgi:signal recognition particle receptor subunit beta
MESCKIVFTGPMGAGKTTAIGAVSEVPTVSTETLNTDFGETDKPTTTVAFDYGECKLDDGSLVRLYGTPGQSRFEFMWKALAQGAIGVVLLLDDRRDDPLDDALEFLDAFREPIAAGAAVVGLGRFGAGSAVQAAELARQIEAAGYRLPVVDVDVRRADDVRMLLQILVAQLEVHG